jgi:hypothetical protein
MRTTSFEMFGDISHTPLANLTKRAKTVVVIASNHPGGCNMEGGVDEQPMEPCIELFRESFAHDMAFWSGIVEKDGNPVGTLPYVLGISCLLNPMYGGTYCL